MKYLAVGLLVLALSGCGRADPDNLYRREPMTDEEMAAAVKKCNDLGLSVEVWKNRNYRITAITCKPYQDKD